MSKKVFSVRSVWKVVIHVCSRWGLRFRIIWNMDIFQERTLSEAIMIRKETKAHFKPKKVIKVRQIVKFESSSVDRKTALNGGKWPLYAILYSEWGSNFDSNDCRLWNPFFLFKYSVTCLKMHRYQHMRYRNGWHPETNQILIERANCSWKVIVLCFVFFSSLKTRWRFQIKWVDWHCALCNIFLA